MYVYMLKGEESRLQTNSLYVSMLKGEESRLIEKGFIYVCRSHFDMDIFS